MFYYLASISSTLHNFCLHIVHVKVSSVIRTEIVQLSQIHLKFLLKFTFALLILDYKVKFTQFTSSFAKTWFLSSSFHRKKFVLILTQKRSCCHIAKENTNKFDGHNHPHWGSAVLSGWFDENLKMQSWTLREFLRNLYFSLLNNSTKLPNLFASLRIQNIPHWPCKRFFFVNLSEKKNYVNKPCDII